MAANSINSIFIVSLIENLMVKIDSVVNDGKSGGIKKSSAKEWFKDLSVIKDNLMINEIEDDCHVIECDVNTQSSELSHSQTTSTNGSPMIGTEDSLTDTQAIQEKKVVTKPKTIEETSELRRELNEMKRYLGDHIKRLDDDINCIKRVVIENEPNNRRTLRRHSERKQIKCYFCHEFGHKIQFCRKNMINIQNFQHLQKQENFHPNNNYQNRENYYRKQQPRNHFLGRDRYFYRNKAQSENNIFNSFQVVNKRHMSREKWLNSQKRVNFVRETGFPEKIRQTLHIQN